MSSTNLSAVSAIAAALFASVVYAGEEPDAPLFSFNAFGTLGVVHSSEDQADFTSSVYEPDGAGYSRSWSADVDSLIAAQITANFSPRLSAVVQVVSQQNYDNTYRPHVEWANIKYQFTPDFSVRVGRSVLAPLLYSETRLVGYTYPWVRPPPEVYGLSPFTSYDGMDASYRLHFGELTNTLRATVGKNDTHFTASGGGGSLEVRRLVAVSNTIESGPLTMHVSYWRSYITVPAVQPLFDAFRQFGPQGVEIADQYDLDHKVYYLIGVGASYDPGQWFMTGEWAHVNTHSFVGKRTAWHVGGGYRFGPFTPYLTYAQVHRGALAHTGLTVSALPPFLAGPATFLNAALSSAQRQVAVQNTVSLGGRWDVMKNISLKLQLDHTRIGAGSNGGLINLQPDFQPGGKINVFSATIDFVF